MRHLALLGVLAGALWWMGAQATPGVWFSDAGVTGLDQPAGSGSSASAMASSSGSACPEVQAAATASLPSAA